MFSMDPKTAEPILIAFLGNLQTSSADDPMKFANCLFPGDRKIHFTQTKSLVNVIVKCI